MTDRELTWLTVPDLASLLGIFTSRVRRLIEDRSLLAARIDGVLRVPDIFLRDGAPLPELRGTLILLADSGFSDDEAMHWLLSDEESLGKAPIDALLDGRKAEVRRIAQALAI
ncbi:MAG: Rv2175c family DNA-binding protein [Terrimesophilobacter sp.]